MLKPLTLGLALFTSLCCVMPVTAAEYYRYLNDKGVPVLDRQGVPPEFIEKGYQVVDDQGRVVREISPAPSKEERERLANEKAKAASDAQLLRIYSESADVERARDRKLAELDGVIGVAQSNLSSLRTQQANLQAKAAEYERASRQVPEHLIVQIDNIKAEQDGLEKDIERYRQVRKDAELAFEADRLRLIELRGR